MSPSCTSDVSYRVCAFACDPFVLWVIDCSYLWLIELHRTRRVSFVTVDVQKRLVTQFKPQVSKDDELIIL
jgi:hypothetical protein